MAIIVSVLINFVIIIYSVLTNTVIVIVAAFLDYVSRLRVKVKYVGQLRTNAQKVFYLMILFVMVWNAKVTLTVHHSFVIQIMIKTFVLHKHVQIQVIGILDLFVMITSVLMRNNAFLDTVHKSI
jgi:hypothetical protein